MRIKIASCLLIVAIAMLVGCGKATAPTSVQTMPVAQADKDAHDYLDKINKLPASDRRKFVKDNISALRKVSQNASPGVRAEITAQSKEILNSPQ